MLRLLIGFCVLFAITSALADGVRLVEKMPALDAPRNFGNFRFGASTSNRNGHPDLCLELTPLSFLSVEGCGTGTGVLHNDDQSEVAHFRAKLRLANWRTEGRFVQPHLSAGFAELQQGDDEPGFEFTGTGAAQNETAGPEVGVSLKILAPIGESKYEWVAEVGVSAAWLTHAPDLADPQSVQQTSVALSMGFGF